MWDDADYYSILDVSPSASAEEIKSAFRTLARRYHPDTSGQEHMTRLFRQVHEAYEILSDTEKRKAYDQWRLQKGIGKDVAKGFHLEVLSSHRELPSIDEPQMAYVILDIVPLDDSEAGELPLNLCLVIDHSTSMKQGRLQQVKLATREIIERLGPDDILSVVGFSDRAQAVIPARRNPDKREASALLDGIRADGGTEIYQGLLEALSQVNRWRSSGYVNHVILLTDGQTYGDEQQCLDISREAVDRGITISAIGIGTDWNDELLDAIAEHSGGSVHYTRDANGIVQSFRESMEHLTSVSVPQLLFTVRMAGAVSLHGIFKLTPSLTRLSSNEGRFLLGPLSTHGRQSILLEIVVPPLPPGPHRLLQVEVSAATKEQGNGGPTAEHTLSLSFLDHPHSSEPVPQRIIEVLRQVTIYQMQEKALADANSGRLDAATARLESIATRLLDYGETVLAKAALLEAEQLAKTGLLSAEGKKNLKYGTRNLSKRAPGQPQ